jgi:hypothetical protein
MDGKKKEASASFKTDSESNDNDERQSEQADGGRFLSEAGAV